MNEYITGVLTQFVYDTMRRGVGVATDQKVEDRIERAAETVAAEYSEFDAEHLLNSIQSESIGDHIEQFEQGTPLTVETIANSFREQAVGTYIDATAGEDVEDVIREFLTEIQRELAEVPAVWRTVALRAIKRRNRAIERVEADLDEVREKFEDARVVSATALREAVETTEDQGFEWLIGSDFEDGRVDERYCWRRAFTLGEVREGYPLRRQRPLQTRDGRQDLQDQLLDSLSDGGGAALLGSPGSGKTTATRMVMSEWEKRTSGGTVLYRTKGVQNPLDPEKLNEAIETAREDGPVLVVAEDAARRGTYPLYRTVAEFESASDVSFLVNSRESEWRGSDEELIKRVGQFSQYADDIAATRSEYLRPVDMPPLDAQEVRRFAETYEDVTGRDASVGEDDAESLLEQIRSYSGASPMLLLAYHVPVWEGQIEVRTNADVPALVDNVREVFRIAHDESVDTDLDVETEQEAELLERMALAVNVLNAAELGTWREHLLAFGEDHDEMRAIDELLTELQGPLLFERDGQQYTTHHPLWSRLYLSEHLERSNSPAVARRVFEECVNGLFEFLDSTGRREVVESLLGQTALLESIHESPEPFADQLVRSVFGIGEDRPELMPLFGTSSNTRIDIPDVCPPETAVQVAFRRAGMFNSRGESDRERNEIEWAWERATDAGIDDGVIAVKYHTRRGHYAMQQGEFEAAREQYEQAREPAPGDEESQHEATNLGNLGAVARDLGGYEQAREYLTQSLAIFREIGNRAGEAGSLTNLGLVARNVGEYEQAREYLTQSLAIFREIGDRAGEAKSLDNLGLVAQNRGEYEQAREYHQESLAITREIGDRAGEATSLDGLGMVAQKLGEYGRARERHHECLEIKREIGNRSGEATSLDSLGVVAQNLAEYERARERHHESLEISREIGDRSGEANSLNNLGLVARNLEEYERARQCHHESLDIKREIGDRSDEATSLNNLGLVARNLEEYERARQRHHESLDIKREVGDRRGEANSLGNIGEVAREQGNYRAAIDNYSDAADVFCDIGAVRRALKALSKLSETAVTAGEAETAADACETALELIAASDLDGLDDRAREFQARAARLNETPQSTLELYSHALSHILENEGTTAIRLLRETWERRDTHDKDTTAFSVTLAAGVGFAAHLELIDSERDETEGKQELLDTDEDSPKVDDVLAEIDPDGQSLSVPAASLYRALTDSVVTTTTADLREQAEEIDPDDSGSQLDFLEHRAYAKLLELLSGAADDESPAVEERYERALVHLARGNDTEAVTDTLATVWEQRADCDSGTSAHAAATAAGILLAATVTDADHTDGDAPVDPDAVVRAVDPTAVDFSDAVRAVYDHLAGEEPTHTVDELRERVDPPFENPDLTQLETAVFADALAALTAEDPADQTVAELYRQALLRAAAETDADGLVWLLQQAWERREEIEPGTDDHAVATAAGVGLAAHLELFSEETDEATEQIDSTLSAIDPSVVDLSDAVRAVYDHLAGEEPAYIPEELHDRLNESDDDSDLTRLETAVFARLLEGIIDDDGGNDDTPQEQYHEALVRVNSGNADPDTVVDLLQRAWTQRENYDPDTEEFAAATAAGVAFATYLELLPEQTSDETDRQTILAAIDPAATDLSDSVHAVYDHLTAEEPEHTPDELHDRVDTPVDDDDLPQLETLVFARLLGALDD